MMEETSGLWQSSVDGERQREPEAREPDAVDGLFTAAEINSHRRGSGDKNKSSPSGYQVRGRGYKHMAGSSLTARVEVSIEWLLL